MLIVLVAAFLMLWFVTTNNSSSKSKTHPKPKEVKEVKKLENPNCHLDLQCWGDKHHIAASIRCTGHVEKLAKYSHKWTDGILESKFSQFRWINMDKGIVTYIGDKIQFQNGFGAWQNYTYECDYDPNSDIVIDVRARPTHK
ncbi:MAG: hypothetical protein BWK80_04550 [Desulfobacteraceae bacterium IS3]|nr:MAG: hypothetical protein BWK80_04550 [Desulfobacteraceae bacterium IS3]